MGEPQEVLQQFAQAVVEIDKKAAATMATKQAFRGEIDPYEAITAGPTMGMEIVNEKFENEKYFVPEILLCADAMYTVGGGPISQTLADSIGANGYAANAAAAVRKANKLIKNRVTA